MNKNNNKMDLLGNAPVPQALMALGIPIMIGMLINALYNLVDAYFIGGLGESQMGAISIAFPLGQVVVGLGLMFGNGAASYLSRLLGRGDREAASKVASTALYSSVCIGAVIIIGTAIFLKPILTMLGATDTIMPWELTDKDNIVISFDKYKSDITVSQDLIIGYVKDGIMYEGEVFDELSGKYSFSPDEKGEYFFYLLSGSSDYLSLKSGNLEVN